MNQIDASICCNDNVKKFGTVFNTVAPGTDLAGVMHRQ